MKKIIDQLLNFFKRSKEFPKPFLGMSWDEFSEERKEINRLIKVINDYKIISKKSLIKHPNPFFKVLDITKRIESILVNLDDTSDAIVPLRKLRASCQRFMRELASMDITPSQYHEIYRNFSNGVKIQCAVLISEFWIELDENFEEIEINTSLV
ncbi:MAG: hypothetical protein WBA74_23800 [Cyclobacteriaceae bacterium]